MEAARRPQFGELLRQFRLAAGMTQQRLAERARLSAQAVSALERGARTRPYRETVDLLGRALGLSPEHEMLLRSAIGVAHASLQRERSEVLSASLLRLVHRDAQGTSRHNLPSQLTSFVGRQREVADVAALLSEHRLVTVVGAGGVGKTRVAVQLGTELIGDCSDGVWLVDLAPIAYQTLVASAVLTALQVPATSGYPLDAVVAYLKTRHLLLILDNCEHVSAQAHDVAASIIEFCPYVRVLASSREPLGVPGEWAYRLPSLAVPPPALRRMRDVLPYGAVALFVDRALAANANFTLTEDDTPDVAEICRRLDGIPLAIELAAARVKVLAPRQIAQRLDQRFRLLTGDPKAVARHQTMSALIDWSYDLLAPREQRFFESLSVFAGGCTLEAATAVCATDGEDELDVVDLVASLVTKSLLVAELAGKEQRYRLQESTRHYAWAKLITRGEHERLVRRHALAYLDLAERLDHAWDTTPDLEWLPQAKAELENWRGALDWALAKRGDVVVGQRLVGLRQIIWRAFPLPDAARWVRLALEVIDEFTPPDLGAQLALAEAELAAQFAEHKTSLAAAEHALARYRELEDILGIAQAKGLAAHSLLVLGRPADGMPLLQDALTIARSLNNRRFAAHTLRTMGNAWSRLGDFAAARACFHEALGLAKMVGAEFLAASIVACLASNEYDAGDFETALSLIVDALATYRGLSSSALPDLVTALEGVAKYSIALGRYDDARPYAIEAIEVARALRYAALVAISLQQLAVIALLRPPRGRRTSAEYVATAQLFGFVDARLAALGVPDEFGLPHERDSAFGVLGDAIGANEVTRLTVTGATMTEDEAIAVAQALS